MMQQPTSPRSNSGLFGGAKGAVAPVVERTVSQRMAFVRRVYGWMFAGILATVMGAAISVKSGMAHGIVMGGIATQLLMLVAWMGGAYAVQKVRHKPTWNVLAFAAYALFTGIFISGIVYVAMVYAEARTGSAGTYVIQAMVLTLIAFGSLSAYAFFTKRDFSFMRGMLTVGLVVLVVLLIAGFFIESTALHLVISGFGVMLFAGYTLYDTQKVIRHTPDGEHVAGAMTLFLDFVLLFVYVLRFILMIAAGGDD